jgi:hypothetical protein
MADLIHGIPYSNPIILPVMDADTIIEPDQEGAKVLFCDSSKPNAPVSLKGKDGQSLSVAGGGLVYVTDITPVATDKSVSPKSYAQDTIPNNKFLIGCTSDTKNIIVHFIAEGGATYVQPEVSITIGENEPVICTNLEIKGNPEARCYEGSISISIADTQDIVVSSNTGQSHTVSITYDAPPEITSLRFTRTAPEGQTESKENDVIMVEVKGNRAFDTVIVSEFGAVKAGTFEVDVEWDEESAAYTGYFNAVIANTGNTAQDLPIKCKIVTSTDSTSALFDSSDTANLADSNFRLAHCNNLHPSFVDGGITYNNGYQALKDTEEAIVDVQVQHCDGDGDTVVYSSNELAIPNPSDNESTKTVTQSSNDYNVNTPNFFIAATRKANGAFREFDKVVKIAHTTPTITIQTPADRLRSGGNDGTSSPDHVITIQSDQDLFEAPTLDAGIGVWQGTGFTGSGRNWTRTLHIYDHSSKGAGLFATLKAVNLAGIEQNVINSGAEYEVGGFVSRTLSKSGGVATVEVQVKAITYEKLQLTWTGKSGLERADTGYIGTSSNRVLGWTIQALDTFPTVFQILDANAVGAVSGDSFVTVEEII